MSTIRSPELGPYRMGQLASIPCVEPDPFPDWAAITERDAHDMRSIYVGEDVVASIGYFPTSRTEADAFAVVDREACAGIGAQVARIIHNQMDDWMQYLGINLARATCSANDKAARVFLRAAGFRTVAIENGVVQFKFIRR